MSAQWILIGNDRGPTGATGASITGPTGPTGPASTVPGPTGATGASTPATLPNDITANSVAVAPVSGDSAPVGITLGNGTATLFSVDSTGKLSAASSAIAGNETIGGTLNVTGPSTMGALTVSSLTNTGLGIAAGLRSSIAGTAGAPSFSYTAQTDTGVYLATTSTTAAVLGLAVNGTQALALSKTGILVPGTLAVTSDTVLSGAASVANLLTASGNVKTPLVVTTQAPSSVTINSSTYTNSNVQFPGTFGDGNSYPSSGISSDTVGNLSLNFLGAPMIQTASPAYSAGVGNSPKTPFTTKFLSGAYQFFNGTNLPLSVSGAGVAIGFPSNTNATTIQSLSGNILALKNGGTAPNYTPATVTTVDTSGNIVTSGSASANALTISTSGGRLTFGDGTYLTTVPTASGQASVFTAQSNGTTAAPAFTYAANTDTGVYLKTQSTTGAVLGLSVNATDALTLTKGGVSIPGTLAVTGTATANVHAASALGSASAPVFFSNQQATTGIYFSATPAMVFTAGGTAVASINSTSMNVAQPLNAQSTLAVTGTSAFTGAATFSAASTFSAGASVTGALTATNLTLLSGGGGKLTFADGTTQTTAAAASTAGSAATFSATNNGTATAPSHTFSNQTDTGMYLGTQSTSAAVLSFSANGTSVASLSKTTATFPFVVNTPYFQATSSSTNSTFAGGIAVQLAASFNSSVTSQSYYAAVGSSASAPAYRSNQDTNTGPYYGIGTYSISCGGTGIAQFSNSGLGLTGSLSGVTNVTATGQLTSQQHVTSQTGSAGGFTNFCNAANNSGFWVNSSSSSPVAAGINVGGTGIVTATANAITLATGTNLTGSLNATGQILSSSTAGAFNNISVGNTAGSGGLYFTQANATTPRVGLAIGSTQVFDSTSTATTIALPTTHAGTVTSTTAAGTPSFVSTQGFKQSLACSLWNSAYTANTSSQMKIAVTNDGNSGASGSAPFTYVFPYAGSVTGISFAQTGPISGTNTFSVYKNGTSVVSYSPSSNTSSAIPYSKGSYTFAVGDVLTMFYASSGSGNTQVQCYVSIEQGA